MHVGLEVFRGRLHGAHGGEGTVAEEGGGEDYEFTDVVPRSISIRLQRILGKVLGRG